MVLDKANSIAMNWDTDRHGWAELLPSREARPKLDGSHRVPWAVIGAGLTGLACARRLAELHPYDQILLLDAREVGQAASGRNSGFVVATSQFPGNLTEDRLPHYRRLNRINLAGLDLLESQVKSNAIDCQWQRTGFIHTATDRVALREHAHFAEYLERNPNALLTGKTGARN